MKWLDAPPVRAAQLALTVAVLALLLLGEPECARALVNLGLAVA